MLNHKSSNSTSLNLNKALLNAINANQENIVLKLLDADADINKDRYNYNHAASPLKLALRQNNVNIV